MLQKNIQDIDKALKYSTSQLHFTTKWR